MINPERSEFKYWLVHIVSKLLQSIIAYIQQI